MTEHAHFVAVGGSAKCCNGQFCCKEKHFNQLKTLPCQTDLMCTNFNYGNLTELYYFDYCFYSYYTITIIITNYCYNYYFFFIIHPTKSIFTFTID